MTIVANEKKFLGWVRRSGDGQWRCVAQAATRADAERAASEWARNARLRIFDVVATEANENPNERGYRRVQAGR